MAEVGGSYKPALTKQQEDELRAIAAKILQPGTNKSFRHCYWHRQMFVSVTVAVLMIVSKTFIDFRQRYPCCR